MADFIISEKQLSLINNEVVKAEKLRQTEAIWSKLTIKEREQVVEAFLYLNSKKRLSEQKWGFMDYLQTAGDVVGIFDPTGLVDLANGVTYIIRGQYLFGFLSIVSAVPYAGDAAAKPVMGLLKLGKPSAKMMNKALTLSKAGKTAEASALLTRVAGEGGVTGAFVSFVGKYANKLRGLIERAPDGMFKGLKNTILQWFDLFENAAKAGKAARAPGAQVAKQYSSAISKYKGAKNIPHLEKARLESELANVIVSSKRGWKEKLLNPLDAPNVFTGYGTKKGLFSWKTLFGGMPQAMGRNRSVRALMRQTKFWAGFLDFMGIANFVGPDEYLKDVGEQEFMEKMQDYQQTPQAQANFEQDLNIDLDQGKETKSAGVGYGKIQPLFGLGGSGGKKSSTSSSLRPDSGESNPLSGILSQMQMG